MRMPVLFMGWHIAALSRSVQQKMWLWRNFVDGRLEYWAFDNAYPSEDCGDPLTLGSPVGYALFKPSINGRPDVPDHEVLAEIALSRSVEVSEAMAQCLQECADDLETELLAKGVYTTPAKMARDMEPVLRARVMLAAREAGDALV